MEEIPTLCVDPEEDEIFFYGVTDKEAVLSEKLKKITESEVRIFSENCSQENNQISAVAGVNIESANHGHGLETLAKTKKMPYTKLPLNMSNMPVPTAEESSESENCAVKPTVLPNRTNCQDENESKINLTNTLAAREVRGEFYNELHENETNIYVDHNYSTPVKTVIDKSILKTPKSVVKADKDGGFLKVLSEIALVKAEVDENTHSDVSPLSGPSPKKEITSGDNKENMDKTIAGLMESTEVTPVKLLQDLAIGKLNDETQKDKFPVNASSEMPKDIMPFTSGCEKNIINSEIENLVSTFGNKIVPDEDMFSNIKNSHDGNDNSFEINGVEAIFEKLTTNVKKLSDEFNENLADVSDLIKLDSFIGEPASKDPEFDKKQGSIDKLRKETEIREIPVINIIDESLHIGNDQKDDCTSQENGKIIADEHHKKFLRRRTVKLLEELSELVSSEQVKNEPDVEKATPSEEAAKVIQKLKAVAEDDSILSPDQYYDLDNLNETFLSSDVLDILNDTLSKPLDMLTNKDIAVLLERIGAAPLEDKRQPQIQMAEVLDAEKENLCQYKMKETLSRKVENSKIVKTPINLNTGKFQKTPVSLKKAGSTKVGYEQKFTPSGKCLPESKKPNQKPLIQSQPYQNRFRGCRTAEKASKPNIETRIPKLTSTTSKLPIKGSANVKIQNKTPISKTPRSLKFDNIESPVQAYIKAKTPVLMSNVKGKSEPGINVWPKQTTSAVKIKKPETEHKNEPKINLPYVKYRSAIPLKLDKAAESRLPRLAPKMQKLILGNSPVIAKHEGRIQFGTSSKPEISMNESSIVLKPSEVSVIVRKVALKSTFTK